MEERPNDRPQEKRYHHGDEKSPSRPKKTLKNGQSRCHYQHQETQTKKTGIGKINGSTVEGETILHSNSSAGIPHTSYSNGNRHLDTNYRQKQPGKVFTALSKGGSKAVHNKSGMDSKIDKPSEFKPLDKESVSVLNGVVALDSGYITNGYPGKPANDNDGSGSESGYATPKRCGARRSSSSSKGAGDVTPPHERAVQQGGTAPASQELEPFGLGLTEKVVLLQLEGSRGAARTEAYPGATRGGAAACQVGEPQRKNSDVKAAGAFGKRSDDRPPGKAKLSASVTVKEDSWTLFKPPPVFPVDNSSAKIVPKISYASKVKENLNKAAQTGGETPPPQEPGRLSQVPMSALKTITSASFSNGPVSGDGCDCSSPRPLFTAASTVPLASFVLGGEDVAPSSNNDSSTTTTPSAATGEQRKSSLFVYPLTPSNMQNVLPSAHQADAPVSQTNQKALGDIFQNQWGLSFINEPNVGPSCGNGHATALSSASSEVTFQGECPLPSLAPEPPPGPKAFKADRRTSPQPHSSALKVCRESSAQTQSAGQGTQKARARAAGTMVVASPKDLGPKGPLGPLTNSVIALATETCHARGSDRRCSWGSFDLKAAVIYHTKEIENILNLQKQDPKRVVVYNGTMDGPGQ